jgi:hypothetical protein
VRLLQEQGIYNISFDLRPRSFNFIPMANLLEIIKHMSDFTTITLHFANEKDYVINKIISEIKDMGRNCSLEFSDQKSLDYYESFKLPFYLYYYPQILQLKWRYLKNFKGIMIAENQLSNSTEVLLELVKLKRINKINTVYLSSLINSKLNLNNFNSLELFPEHETSYRVPDYSKIKNSISNLLKHTTP